MRLHQLPPITQRGAKRVGRGRGSGKGRYATRGVKGQKKRSRIRRALRTRYLRQLALLRGKGFKGPRRYPVTVNLGELNRFRSGSTVTVEKLVEEGLVPRQHPWGVKLLATGKLKKKLKFSSELRFSAGARRAVEEAGGEILTSS